MTTAELISIIQEIAKKWYWIAEVKATRVENGKTITTLVFATADYSAPRRGAVKPFEVELVGNDVYTIIVGLNMEILRLGRLPDCDDDSVEELESFTDLLEDIFGIE